MSYILNWEDVSHHCHITIISQTMIRTIWVSYDCRFSIVTVSDLVYYSPYCEDDIGSHNYQSIQRVSNVMNSYIICQCVMIIILILTIVVVNNESSIRKECEHESIDNVDSCIHDKRVENERILRMKIDQYNQLLETVTPPSEYNKEELMIAYALFMMDDDDY